MSAARVLVVGWDGATTELVRQFAHSGDMPTTRRLIAAGSIEKLRSIGNTTPGWATLATGANPGRHGVFHSLGLTEDRAHWRSLSGADLAVPTIWQIASAHGLRSVVVNVPFTHPARSIDGVLVAGADAGRAEADGACYPPEFLRDLRQTGVRYRIASRLPGEVRRGRPSEGLQDAFGVETARSEATLAAMNAVNWDLGLVVYDLPDVVEHFFWEAMSDGGGPHAGAIRDAYRHLDRQLACLLAHLGVDLVGIQDDGTAPIDLLVVSDHGFGPLCATRELLADWLIGSGYMVRIDSGRRSPASRIVGAAYRLAGSLSSEGVKDELRARLGGVRTRVESHLQMGAVDWRHTRCFVGPAANEIWINRCGREPEGVVEPGEDYFRLRAEVAAALLDWRDQQTGARRVRAVHYAEDVYCGPLVHLAPDLTVEWNTDAAPDPTKLPGNSAGLTGDHQPEGVLLAVGPHFRSQDAPSDAGIVDIAPTVLDLLALPGADQMDGRVLRELLSSDA